MRKEFDSLNGLRAIAAFVILLCHVFTPFDYSIFPHSYLAVDFFFLLSGFVISYAYEARLKSGLSVTEFMRIRLIRLYPLLLIGVAMGAAVALLKNDPSELWDILGAVGFGLFMLPSPFYHSPANMSYFPLNNPAWSLFYEIFGNLAYALVLPLLTRRVLVGLIVASGLLRLWFFMHFGDAEAGELVASFPYAAPRFVFPFLLGVLVYRSHEEPLLQRVRLDPLLLGGLLLAVFCVPLLGPVTPAFDTVLMIVGAPLMLVAGLNAAPSPLVKSVCKWTGAVSYPVFILQYPIIRAAGHYARDHVRPEFLSLFLWGEVVAIVAFCWLVLRTVDMPVRDWLNRWNRSRKAVDGRASLGRT